MNYKSTRNSNHIVSPSQAILNGLAPDGGLYVPTTFPKFNFDWQEISQMSYQDLTLMIMQPFLSDYSSEQLQTCIAQAYDHSFTHPRIAPLRKVKNDYYLELFHGPSLSFKDIAVSMLPHLMNVARENTGNQQQLMILTVSSGNSGKAVLESFKNIPDTHILVFYPKIGINSIQEKQMITHQAHNANVVSVIGNFDQTQSKVTETFKNPEFHTLLANEQVQLSSANSMNIGRILPQIVYYFYAYGQLISQNQIELGEEVDFSIPTGNFGNILAGYYAKKIGLPIHQLICASNDNKALFEFFKSGEYNLNRPFYSTISPSLDILVSNNLERLLYHALEEDSGLVAQLMENLQSTGKFSIAADYHDKFNDFIATFITELETKAEIRRVFDNNIYLMDPHTAVASAGMSKLRQGQHLKHKQIILSTASAYKFPDAILSALNIPTSHKTDKQLLTLLKDILQSSFPKNIEELLSNISRTQYTISLDDIPNYVRSLAKNIKPSSP